MIKFRNDYSPPSSRHLDLTATRLYVHSDSELVIDQVMKESSCKSPLMEAYCQEVHKLEDKF